MSTRVNVLSGLGGKLPAAVLVCTPQARLLLDAGATLPGGELPAMPWWQGLEVDAVVLSHDHPDHMDGLCLLPPHVPVYATAATARRLPPGRAWRALPERGELDIAGLRVRTGQAGHALGGVWLHLDIAGGLFYSGDFCLESRLFAFDPPPPAELALLDASYGLYDQSQAACEASVQALLDEPTLLPVPPSGRALELAMWFIEQGRGDFSLDADCQASLRLLLERGPAMLRPGAYAALERLQRWLRPFDRHSPLLLAGDPDAQGGMARQLLETPGFGHRVVYTGYMPPGTPRTQVCRWNVHPRRRDLRALVGHLGARRCVPLFTGYGDHAPWRRLLNDTFTPIPLLECSHALAG